MLQTLVADASAAQSRGDLHAAADAYRKATELEPNIPELWANLGLMDHQIGESSEAIESFKHAIHLKPTLFVPQLFLGIEYLSAKNPAAALPYLESAEKLNPGDLQAALSLGSTYSMLDRGSQAVDSYLKATQIAPSNGNAWLGLGTAYLQQVEDDARLMTTTYNHSPYLNLREAETFAEEGKLVQAENAYMSAVAPSSPAPCAHTEFGITLLRQKKVAEAREQFQLETKTSAHCALARLGLAVAGLASGHSDSAFKEISAIAAADSGFLYSNLILFRGAISADQVKSLIDFARSQEPNGEPTSDLSGILKRVFLSDDPMPASNFSQTEISQAAPTSSPADAQHLFLTGQYSACDQALRPALRTLTGVQLQLLVSCAYYGGDFRTASIAAERIRANPATVVQGLYWESKADQILAVAALDRAGEIDPDSPRMHVLIGDAFRQKRRWDDAEAEYRKAVALDPKSRSARLSLAIVLFTELKTDEAFAADQSLLAEMPEDPESNLLAGEILVQRHEFEKAEPYLSKCQGLKPEFTPRLHILLGQVYAATDRLAEAIVEYKQGLTGDEDGSIHYQLARLYQKAGDENAAAEQIRISKQLREHWDNQAHVALKQLETDTSRQ